MPPATIVTGLTGGLAGAIITACINTVRERRVRRRTFRTFIRCIEKELSLLMVNWKHIHKGNPYFLYDWQSETAKKLVPIVATVLEDIRKDRQSELGSLLLNFGTQGSRNVEPYEGKQPDKPLLFSDKEAELAVMLKAMGDCAK